MPAGLDLRRTLRGIWNSTRNRPQAVREP